MQPCDIPSHTSPTFLFHQSQKWFGISHSHWQTTTMMQRFSRICRWPSSDQPHEAEKKNIVRKILRGCARVSKVFRRSGQQLVGCKQASRRKVVAKSWSHRSQGRGSTLHASSSPIWLLTQNTNNLSVRLSLLVCLFTFQCWRRRDLFVHLSSHLFI